MWYFIILPPSHVVHQLLSTHWVGVSEITRIDNWNLMISFLNFPIRWERIVQEIDFLSPERSSREGWESKSKDGANISFQWGCQDPFLVAVDRLVHEPEGNKSIYKPTTCGVPLWAQALLCSGKPKCMLMVSKQLHPRSPDICFISKEDSSEISILDSHYHPATRRDW